MSVSLIEVNKKIQDLEDYLQENGNHLNLQEKKLFESGNDVLKHVKKIVGKNPKKLDTVTLTNLNNVLLYTNKALNECRDPEKSKKNAEELANLSTHVSGKSSRAWKSLGISLLVFASAALVVAGVLAAIPTGGSSLLLSAIGGVGLATTLGVGAGVAATGAIGAAALYHGREKGLAKSVHKFKDALNEMKVKSTPVDGNRLSSELPKIIDGAPEIKTTAIIPNQDDLRTQVDNLIKNFNSVEDFHNRCGQIVEQYGFSKFKNVVDQVLVNKDMLESSKRSKNLASALYEADQFITQNMSNTIASIALKSAQIQSQGLLNVFRKSNSDFQGKALEMAEKESYAGLKNRLKENVLSEAKSEIKVVKEGNGTEQEKQTNLPLDYYIEKARVDELKTSREVFLIDSAQYLDLISDFIRSDILSHDDIRQRTLTMNRYVVMAIKLAEEGNLNAANAIATCFHSSEIHRLNATKGGIPTQVKEKWDALNTLLSPEHDYAKVKEFIDKHPSTYYLPNNCATILEYLIAKFDSSIKLDKNGNVESSLSEVLNYKKLQVNATKIMSIPAPTNVNTKLLDEICKNKDDFSDPNTIANKKVERKANNDMRDKELLKISHEIEPKGNTLPASPVIQEMKNIYSNMTSAHGAVFSQVRDLYKQFREAIALNRNQEDSPHVEFKMPK